ncbi:MAG: phosphoglycolate phosphatase [Methylococcaceae bacterium]|nr:phosphoglycolate phosphatase [Methylococcaceae bacterium]MCI0733979.1 phosphoglycolate phosphatase [Methylococcaceae bacterium]
MARPRLVVIDLDGTLIDSAPDLIFAAQKMLEQLGQEPVGAEEIRNWIGNGVTMLVKRVLTRKIEPDEPVNGFDRAQQIFSDLYAANLSERSRLYPGVQEGLEELRREGFLLACITNKHSRFTGRLLEQIGLAGYFRSVVCGDTYEERKPHPMPLLKTAERFNIEPCEAVMVGDSINDVRAARAAGFLSVCVPYGYVGSYTVEELGADHVIESIAELPALLATAI